MYIFVKFESKHVKIPSFDNDYDIIALALFSKMAVFRKRNPENLALALQSSPIEAC